MTNYDMGNRADVAIAAASDVIIRRLGADAARRRLAWARALRAGHARNWEAARHTADAERHEALALDVADAEEADDDGWGEIIS